MAEEQETTEVTESEGRNPLSLLFFKIPFVVVILIIVVIAALAVVVVKKNPQVLSVLGVQDSQQQAQAEVQSLLNEVGKLIALPEGENPTVATVTDAEKIKEQSFFKNAQNGDKVLIFPNSRKVILYRPEEKKIVEVGSINLNQQITTSPEPSATPEGEEVMTDEEPTEEPSSTAEPTEAPVEE